MGKDFTILISGDSIIRTRLSVCRDEGFLSLIETIRNADAALTQLEVVVHDYEGPEVYPAAESGHNWSQAPDYVVDELKWAGFDIVSTASNHSLDYAYGGVYSTLEALKKAGMPYAGTGMNLALAREPGYFDSPNGRVGLVSMVSSFVKWSRAGDAKKDMRGRPGVNPLRFYHKIDARTAESLKAMAHALGQRIYEHGDLLWFTESGAENTITKYRIADVEKPVTVADEQDVAGNLTAIHRARKRSDYVVAHLHSHEFDPEKGIRYPPQFTPPFARACIDEGADIFISQGSHAPLRGIEIYNGKPIFYETGDIIPTVATNVNRLPADFYQRHGFDLSAEESGLDTLQEFDRTSLVNPVRVSPFGKAGKLQACIVPICTFDENRKLTELKLQPVIPLRDPASVRGLPTKPDPEMSRRIVEHVAELSEPWGTRIAIDGGIGVVAL